MVNVRQKIVADASVALSRAVCIATRYSAVRRQFGSKEGGLETQVSCKVPLYMHVCSLLLEHSYFINKCCWDFSIFFLVKMNMWECETI